MGNRDGPPAMGRVVPCALAVAVSALLALTALASTASASHPKAELFAPGTVKKAEIRDKIPITRRAGAGRRVVLSLPLPNLRRGDRVRAAAEAAISTTCIDPGPRCIGDAYDFNPHIRARVVLTRKKRSTGGRAISRRADLQCGQRRPNRNHHCPIVVDDAGFEVRSPKGLPCPRKRCRLNYVLSADNDSARGGEVVVVGGDRPDGSIEQDKGRLSAVVIRAGRRELEVSSGGNAVRRQRRLEPSISGGKRVIYTKKLKHLERGDVLSVRARQRSATSGDLPYFVSSQLIVTSKRRATSPTKPARKVVSANGDITRTNGFNCTPGPSAFRSPCTSLKAGIVFIKRTPKRPLFVSLISRTFPLVAQNARSRHAPLRILGGGGIGVQRLRVHERRHHRNKPDRDHGGSNGGGGDGKPSGGNGGPGGDGDGSGDGGLLPGLPPLPPLPPPPPPPLP